MLADLLCKPLQAGDCQVRLAILRCVLGNHRQNLTNTLGRCFFDALYAIPSQVSAPAARAASSAAEVTEKRFSAFPGRLTSTVLPEGALKLGFSVT